MLLCSCLKLHANRVGAFQCEDLRPWVQTARPNKRKAPSKGVSRTQPSKCLITLPPCPALLFLPTADSVGTAMPSSPLTLLSAHHHQHPHHDHHHDNSLRNSIDPLNILTAEGRFGTTPGWLLGEGGECKLVVSGMDKIGELDPGEVR